MANKTTYNLSNFRPIGDKVFVTDMDAGARKTKGGIIIRDDDMRDTGIRSRWARVWKIGPDVQDLNVGEWVLLEHGRWSNGIDIEMDDGTTLRVWHADYPNGILVVSDSEEDPREERTF